jgi:hypothetical protein
MCNEVENELYGLRVQEEEEKKRNKTIIEWLKK